MSAPIKQIGARSFSFGKMTATNAVRVQVALMRVLGEPIFKLIVLGTGKKKPPAPAPAPAPAPDGAAPAAAVTADAPATTAVMGVELDAEDLAIIGTAFGLLTSKMDAEELLATMQLVLTSVRCEGAVVDSIDGYFGDGLTMELWQVFVAALKENFSRFFPASLSALLVKATQK